MNEQNIYVRLCKPEDIPQVISLNLQWQRKALNGDLSKGFVTGEIDEKYLMEVITRKEIVVALHQHSVIGYYMVNDIDHAPINYSKIKEMIGMEYIAPDIKVALAAQTAIKVNYHGRGIKKIMMEQLIPYLKANYDIMVSSINKKNFRSLKSNAKDENWKVFDQDQEYVYVCYNLHWEDNNKEPIFIKKLLPNLLEKETI